MSRERRLDPAAPCLSAARPSFHAIVAACCKTRSNAYKIDLGVALSSATDWALAAAILVGAAIVALLLHAALLWLARRFMGERRTFLRTRPRRDQRADAARPAAYSARHRVADDAARQRRRQTFSPDCSAW